MAQVPYRGNLSAKVFPFLSSQFGRTTIIGGYDQVANDSVAGDSNIPQAYYMHNVVPTAQGYKSVGYSEVLPPAGINFDRVIPVRNPDMWRGLLGFSTSGRLFIYRAGDNVWTEITAQVPGWGGGAVSVGYANGYTYICFSKYNVFKVDVFYRTLVNVVLNGLVQNGIVAITSSANYLVATDGVSIYWSSTITPEDFVPSLTTGAGSGTPSDVDGIIIALVNIRGGFAIYTAVNVVIASYSQNARYPWIFRQADNAKGLMDVQHVTFGGEDGSTYAWTSAGLQKITSSGSVSVMAEVTDFLTGQEFEDFDSATNTITNHFVAAQFKIKLAFLGARYLVISYGILSITHALVYDTVLHRWGKLKFSHTACFELTLNVEGNITSNLSAKPKKTLGFVNTDGTVTICNFENNADADDSVLILGKFQLTRSRMTTLEKVALECVDSNNESFSVTLLTTLDGKTVTSQRSLAASTVNPKFREYPVRATGLNHSLLFKGKFNLNSFELNMHVNGRR